VFVGSSARDI
jgi:hypothetical protein